MAALRREGRRFAPLISPQPITAVRSSLISEYDLCRTLSFKLAHHSLSLSLIPFCLAFHIVLSSDWLLRKANN
jgi:hypothetical protein